MRANIQKKDHLLEETDHLGIFVKHTKLIFHFKNELQKSTSHDKVKQKIFLLLT